MRNWILGVMALIAVGSVAAIAHGFFEPQQVWDVKKMHFEMHGTELTGEQAEVMIEMHESMNGEGGMQQAEHQNMHEKMHGTDSEEGVNEMMGGKMHGGKKKGGCR